MKFKVSKIKRGKYAGQWRFAIIAANNEKLDPRQPYDRKAGALNAVELIKGMADAPVEVVE
jgi:uncharacterized protein YegP (UPF0339 family)